MSVWSRSVVATAVLAASVAQAAPESSGESLSDRVERLESLIAAQATAPESAVGATEIGAYAELHLNRLDNENGPDKNEIDFHRFVVMLHHEFTDRLRFVSELELEHSLAGEGKEGEVELEQAFVEYDLNAGTRVRAGLFLIPVGILNETHEPDTFYGVERNPVESNIIPTTWWEAGAGVGGELAPGWSYDFAVHSGLFLEPGSGDFKVRSGRQKVSEARADTGAATGRVRFTGIAGLELGAAVNYQSDLAQDQAGDSIDAFLYEVHAAYRSGPFGVRALYASWQIDDAINMVAAGADEQSGFYVEPSYRLCERWGLFAQIGRAHV